MLGMVQDAEQIHIGDMKKSPRVTFKMQRIAEGDWQIVAECPGAETQYIKGLKSKEEVDEWLAGTRRIAWLRSQGVRTCQSGNPKTPRSREARSLIYSRTIS